MKGSGKKPNDPELDEELAKDYRSYEENSEELDEVLNTYDIDINKEDFDLIQETVCDEKFKFVMKYPLRT